MLGEAEGTWSFATVIRSRLHGRKELAIPTTCIASMLDAEARTPKVPAPNHFTQTQTKESYDKP